MSLGQQDIREVRTDLLVLGGGGAGLFAALHAWEADPELDITVAVKGLIGKSGCTRMVQGGYNVVLDPEDSCDLHLADTLKGGGFVNDQELAWTLVTRAPERIREMELKLGCFFDRRADGRIHQKAFAGQSFDRTVHKGDLTGIEIMNRLRDTLFRTSVRALEECRGLELILDPGGKRLAGVLLLDIRRGEFVFVRCRAVVVATGGGATMYRISAPSLEKSGDGMAMAFRAGAELVDMEMMQFHPTGLLAGRSRLNGAVLEEGLRGAGVHMRNGLGERYMARYDPARLERSTRDVVSRSSFMEIQAGRGTPNGGVWLDVSHLGAAFVERNFPGMVQRCRDIGLDLAREPVEVSPTAHFHMGGAAITPTCDSSITGLFVAGEDAGGVHGANRLGGNGVAESTVFGGIAGDRVAAWLRDADWAEPDLDAIAAGIEAAEAPLGRPQGENVYRLRGELEDVMWERVGLVRDAAGLQATLATLDELEARLAQTGTPGPRRYHLAWGEALNLRNILTVARLIAESALARDESRGSHYRSDFPETRNPDWLRNVRVQREPNGATRLWTTPVRLTRMQPEPAMAASR